MGKTGPIIPARPFAGCSTPTVFELVPTLLE